MTNTKDIADIDKNEEKEDGREEKKEEKAPRSSKKERYYEAVGRRKSATSRVRLYTKVKGFTINNRALEKYFPLLRLQKTALDPLEKIKLTDKLGGTIKVKGGGLTAQSEAVRLGVARALLKFNPIFAKRLRKLSFLTRDSRVVERKKYGLKKARRAPQWKKR